MLPVIRVRLPLAVPEPRWVIERSDEFPYGVSGYPMLPGPPLTEAMFDERNAPSLAHDVAELLLAMHAIPAAELEGLGLPGPAPRVGHYHMLRDETAPALRERLTTAEYERIDAWWESFLHDPRVHDFEPGLSHGDLWYENMLVDDGARALHRRRRLGARLADGPGARFLDAAPPRRAIPRARDRCLSSGRRDVR